MKVLMMIEALIIVHLWSLIVAGGAWVLQRDGHGRVGARFPAPNIWLGLIGLSFLPGVLYLVPFGAAISLPQIEAFELLPMQVSDRSAEGAGFLNLFAVYLGLSLLFISRTVWRWSRLQRLPLGPTAEPDIFTTTAALPPLTLSWPRKAIVIPVGIDAQAALIRHERAHLRHNDAELTLLLLLLQDMMLRGPGIGYLVRQWRLSIELRADHAAIKTLTAAQRKTYAALLLNIQRPTGDSRGALPCPTARLGSARHRNVKMRLGKILKNEPFVRERRWVVALFLASVGASGVGLLSAVAAENVDLMKAESGQVDYVQVDYVKQTPLQMPASCPGLKRDDIKTEQKELTVNGRLVSQHTMKLGTVILSHEISRIGSIHDPRIIASTHPCFEAQAKAAIVQWMAEPQESHVKNAAVKLHFVLSGATPRELERQLNDLIQ